MRTRKRVVWGKLLAAICVAVSFSIFTSFTSPMGADAARDERTLSLYEIHTKVTTTVTFKRDGKYVPEALEKLNWALRDWRRNLPTKMDPKLFDLVWELHRELGSHKPVHVVSGYRSPQTNEKLRRAGGGQAKRSQHMLGKAMDIHFPDVPMRVVRNSALVREWGGVGYYPTSAIPFVHVDTGRVRAWPRLPRLELAMLFPNTRTKHVPADGHPLGEQDRRKARVMLAQIERKKKAKNLIAKANIPTNDPAPEAETTVVASLDNSSGGMEVPGLDQHSKNLWINKVGGGTQMMASLEQEQAELNAATRPLPPMRPLNAAAPEKPKFQMASFQPAATFAWPDNKAKKWISAAAKRSGLLTMLAEENGKSGTSVKPNQAARNPTGLAQVASLTGNAIRPPHRITQTYRTERVAYAPAYDDEHPDELAYRPFQILPLMSSKPIVENTDLIEMEEPEYARISELITASENIPMEFRPSPAAAEMRWMDQFRGNAIINLRKRADIAPVSSGVTRLALR